MRITAACGKCQRELLLSQLGESWARLHIRPESVLEPPRARGLGGV